MNEMTKPRTLLALSVAMLALPGCSDDTHPAPYTFTGRHIRVPPPPPPQREHCPTTSSFSKAEQTCLPRRAGPPVGARATGRLRFVRAPLVQVFPRIPGRVRASRTSG